MHRCKVALDPPKSISDVRHLPDVLPQISQGLPRLVGMYFPAISSHPLYCWHAMGAGRGDKGGKGEGKSDRPKYFCWGWLSMKDGSILFGEIFTMAIPA
ncbi:hypothetical protein IQ272_19440 [Chroococcidiopsidales cyanobacterium LEGE 13417]|nr:hypothetical protein [Chroococcidiopsidales cyanobacterium LEGE 13417]